MSETEFPDEFDETEEEVALEDLVAAIDESLMEDLINAYLSGDREGVNEIIQELPADIPKAQLAQNIGKIVASQNAFSDDY